MIQTNKDEIIGKILKFVNSDENIDATIYELDEERRKIVISKFKAWFEEESPDDIEQDVTFVNDDFPELEIELTVKNDELEKLLKDLGFKKKNV